MNTFVNYIFCVLIFFCACSAPARLDHVEKKQYAFSAKEFASVDSSILQSVLPYKTKLDAEVNILIGKSVQAISKNQPEGLLGNFAADLSLEESKKHYYPEDNKNIDFCFLNNGGLRAALPAGEITKRNIFEVMPFENELIVLSLTGSDVKQLLNYIVSKNGIPIGGLRMKIKNKEAVEVMINNSPFDSTKIYKVVTSDYLANGGDNLFFLAQAKKREYINLKIRDAMIEHIQQLTKDGKLIDPKLDGRITIE
ncbi:MAG TPA: 5'-nucleotidase [Bacteroidia bacterium]|nr:5'-nucleotidase [Bacteroidia bacterium]